MSKKKPSTSVNNFSGDIMAEFDSADLTNFCIKPLYRIVMLNPADDLQSHYLELLVTEGTIYQHISLVYFILFQDIRDLINKPQEYDIPLPKKFLPILDIVRPVCAPYLEAHQMIPEKDLARCVKLKIMMKMYEMYRDAVKAMFRRKALAQELAHLCDNIQPPSGKKKGAKGEKQSKDGKKSKSTKKDKEKSSKKDEKQIYDERTIDDYTKIKLEPNPEVYEDDIYNQEIIFVLTGFINYPIIGYMINDLQMPIMAFIELNPSYVDFDESCSGGLDRAELFWCSLKNNLYGSNRLPYLEDSVLLDFVMESWREKPLIYLKEFLTIVKTFFEIKLVHLKYLKSLSVLNVTLDEFIPMKCFTTYNNFVNRLPPELQDVPVLLEGVLREVTERSGTNKRANKCLFADDVDKPSHYELVTEKNESDEDRCECPFKTRSFFPHKQKKKAKKQSEPPIQTYVIEASDRLGNIAHCYGNSGAIYASTTVNMYKHFMNIYLLRDINMDKYTDFIHKHSQASGSVTTLPNVQQELNHFMYLFLLSFLHNLQPIDQPVLGRNELNRNCQIFSPLHEYHELIFRRFEDRSETTILMTELDKTVNLYQPTLANYHWVEYLSSDVLLQKLWKASRRYYHVEKCYCDETGVVLVQFHDNLNEDGLSTITSQGSIRTPLCLRDFCRYTSVFESEWIMNHLPEKYTKRASMINTELCEGGRLLKENPLYSEFSSLISIRPVKETDPVSFQERLNEILNYPQSKDILSLYEGQDPDYTDEMYAFDLGTRYYTIKGGINIFQSHDDVRVISDTTRISDDAQTCNIKIISHGISLHIPSNLNIKKQEYYSYHFTLRDNTIITFAHKQRVRSSITLDNTRESKPYKSSDDLSFEKSFSTDVEGVQDLMIPTVENEYLQEMVKSQGSEEDTGHKVTFHDKNDPTLLQFLKKAVEENRPIRKINRKYKYTKPVVRNGQVPLSLLLNRLILKSKPKFKNYNRKFYNAKKQNENRLNDVEFVITLRNTLRISLCEAVPNEYKIKQQFMKKGPQLEGLEHDDYRIFCKTGHVLIKLKDGTIKIMSHLGTLVVFEKPHVQDGIGFSSVDKPCVCADLNSYRKKLQGMFKNEFYKKSKNYISRRHIISNKKRRALSDSFKLLDNLPFNRVCIVNLMGKMTVVEGDTIKESVKYFTSKEWDFVMNTISYERTDNFKCLLFETGEIHVKFPDNTKIICWYEIAPEEVFGFVFISIGFTFEHPFYNSIHFNPDGSFSIPLPSGVVVKHLGFPGDQFQICVADGIEYRVQKEWIKFAKPCKQCPGTCVGKVSLNSFIYRRLTPTDRLIKLVDSYGKIFYWNLNGRCCYNSNYKRSTNNHNCPHDIQRNYRKLFLVNKDFSGQMFWNNYMSSRAKQCYENASDTKISSYESKLNSNILISDFRRKFFTNYYYYYNNILIVTEQFCLNEYKTPVTRKEYYETFFRLHAMLNEQVIQMICTHLRKCLTPSEDIAYTELLRVVSSLFDDTENFDTEIYKAPAKTIAIPKCNCKIHFMTMKDKMDLWRNQIEFYKEKVKNVKDLCYFTSEFSTFKEPKQ